MTVKPRLPLALLPGRLCSTQLWPLIAVITRISRTVHSYVNDQYKLLIVAYGRD
jgi:hypothetical protein